MAITIFHDVKGGQFCIGFRIGFRMYEQVGFDLPVVIRSTSDSYMNIKQELVKICISKYRLLLRTFEDIDVKINKS